MASPRNAAAFAALFACLAASRGVASPVSLRLVDDTGLPLAAVRVSLPGRPGSVVTDTGGNVRLDDAPPVPFEVAVFDARGTFVGLARVESLPSTGPAELRLSRGAKATAVVQGLAPSTPAPPAGAASIVTARELAERGPDRLADTLSEMPGTGRLEEGQSVVPSVRGLARGRTLLMLDDGRITSERRAGPSASWLNPFVLENLEAVRGPGSVLYGSDSFGGIVHARSPLPSLDGFHARYQLSAGNGPEEAGVGVEANVPVGPGAILGQFTQRAFRDYDAPTGRVDNSAARDRSGSLRFRFPVGSATLLLGAQLGQSRDMGKPSLDSSVTRAFYPREDSSRFTLGADVEDLLGFSAVEVRAFLGRYVLVTDRDRLATAEETRRLAEADVGANDASLRATGRRPLGRGTLQVGLEAVSRYNLHATNTFFDFDTSGAPAGTRSEVAIDTARQIGVAAFAELEQALVPDLLSVTAALRGDSVSTQNRGGTYGDRSTSHTALSGVLAATWTPVAGTSLTAQYAHGFRDPLLSDRYFRGVSGRGFVVGNPDLLPETSDQFDLALRSRFGALELAAYGYYYRIHDLVERYQEGTDFYFRNRGTEEIVGGELEAGVRVSGNVDARLFGTVLRGKILDDGTDAADVPADSVGLSIDVRPIPRLWLRARGTLFARKDRPGPTEIATPTYGLVDLAGGYQVGPGLEVRVALGNLFDKEYPATQDALAVAGPGRHVAVSVAGRF